MEVEEVEFELTPAKAKGERTRVPRPRRARATSTVSTKDVNATTAAFAKLLVLLTLILMYAKLKRYGIADMKGERAEALALTDEEATEISRPIARMVTNNSALNRVAKPIVDNQDVIGAVFALYEYNRRTDAYFQALTRGQLPGNIRSEDTKSEPTQSVQSNRPASDGNSSDGAIEYPGYDPGFLVV